MDAASRAGVRVGSAPDTVLGTGTQTARAAIDGGSIGRPLAATAVMVTPGHEAWHPNPDFYYRPGGGPLLDMGPYYITALIQLLGPVRSVVGSGQSAAAGADDHLRSAGGGADPGRGPDPRVGRARAPQRRSVDDHHELRLGGDDGGADRGARRAQHAGRARPESVRRRGATVRPRSASLAARSTYRPATRTRRGVPACSTSSLPDTTTGPGGRVVLWRCTASMS